MVKLLRFSEVVSITGVSRSHIYKRVSQGTFPRPLKIGERSVRFRESDIMAWMEGLQVTEQRQ